MILQTGKYLGQMEALLVKKRIKAQIEDVKIRDIESLWSSKYEDAWGQIRDELITKVTSVCNSLHPSVSERVFNEILYSVRLEKYKV